MSSKIIYHGYSKCELQNQYDTRFGVPGIDEIVAKRPIMAESFRRNSPNAKLNISYGARQKEKLDLFFPEGTFFAHSHRPIQMFIHGGYWTTMDKDDFSFVAEPYVKSGAIVAIINYDLCPNIAFTEIVNQVRRCTAWLYKNATSFGGNPDQLHVSGHSAGGHLTGMMLATDWPKFDNLLPANIIKSAVPMSGIYDIEAMRLIKLQKLIKLNKATVMDNSPMFLEVLNNVPTLVAVGAKESDEFHRQSLEYVKHLTSEGLNVTYMDCQGLYHSSLVTETVELSHPFTQARLRLMGLN